LLLLALPTTIYVAVLMMLMHVMMPMLMTLLLPKNVLDELHGY
jgi:hypothetical protein